MEDFEWNSSKVAAALKKRNLFDDDVEDRAFSKLDMDGIETVGWDGTAVVSTEQPTTVQSARIRTSIGGATTDSRRPVTSSSAVSFSKGDAVQLSMPRSQSGTAPVNAKLISSSASLHSMDSSPRAPSIADAVVWSDKSKSVVSSSSDSHLTESAKQEATIMSLKREIEVLRHSTSSDMKPADTVMRILTGKKYVLEVYKSLEEKQQLLRCAVEYHDGNAITAVVLFLRDTLRDTLFVQQLQRHPEAVSHYINFLRLTEDTEKLVQLLSLLGRSEEAAMVKYRQAVSSPNVDNKLRAVQACHSAHFASIALLGFESSLVQQHIDLLQRQQPIDKADDDDQKKGRLSIFREMPRVAAVTGKSVITTLVYTCIYHYDEPETLLSSPQAMRKLFRLTDRQFLISALRGRSKLKRWNDLDAMFQTKSWFGGTKTTTAVSFEIVLRLLKQYDAPFEVVSKFCEKVGDLELRVNLAKKYECHNVALEAIRQLRDRALLEQYERTLVPNSPAWFFAGRLKADTSIKWKN